MGFWVNRLFCLVLVSFSYCVVGESEVRFPGVVLGDETQIGTPVKSNQPPTVHFDRPQNGGSLRKDLDNERFTTVINLSDGELVNETEQPKTSDKKEDAEMVDDNTKGSDGVTLRGRIVTTNKNEMQRKQDGPFELTGNRQNFGLNPIKMLDHATVQLNPQSTLVAPPGQVVSLFFDVTNNLNIPVFFTFRAEDQHNLIRNVFPPRRWIESQRTEVVTVVLETRMHQNEMNTIIFIAQLGSGAELAIRKAFFRIGQPVSDTTGPDIDYSYNGDCRDALTPQTCTTAAWGADITVIDSESGLLSVTSFPLGLQYRGEFVAGTRDYVYLHYSASCCDTKVDVVATDLKGNTYKRTINVERQWWTAAEISAIILGILLLLILIGVIIAGIVTCCRNRGSRDFTR